MGDELLKSGRGDGDGVGAGGGSIEEGAGRKLREEIVTLVVGFSLR
jgi:hypothetical protein